MRTIYVIIISICLNVAVFGQGKTDVSCKIWHPNSFCELPADLNLPCKSFCRNCSMNFHECAKIKTNGKYTGVWLSFTTIKDTLNLESNFANILLHRKDGKKSLRPYALLWYFEEVTDEQISYTKEFMRASFRANIYETYLEEGQHYDMIMLFRQAAPGDKLEIKNFIETKIGN